MNKSTLIAEKTATLNRRKAFKRHLTKVVTSWAIPSPETLSACDREIKAAEVELKHIEGVGYDQTLDFPALKLVDKLGRSLIEGRQALDWSQSKLAKRCGVARQNISRYESAEYKQITLENASRIASVINAELEERRQRSRPCQ